MHNIIQTVVLVQISDYKINIFNLTLTVVNDLNNK